MITDRGRTILAKYLIGQAPAYASHIALGVGPNPIDQNGSFDTASYATKTALDFEVLRIPITSRGYVYEDGAANIVFAGELPGDQRYLFTEIGIYSAKSNPAAGALDSKMSYTFSDSENWEYHSELTASSIPTVVDPLDANASSGQIDNVLDANGNPVTVFRTNSNNTIFNNTIRQETYELPRFLDRTLMVPGDMSFLESSGGNLSVKPEDTEYYGEHIHLTGITADFNRNSSEDELKLAFSIIDKEVGQTADVGGVRILAEFASSDDINPDNFARFQVDLDNSDVIFAANRYIIATQKIGDLIKSSSFTWSTVNTLKIYVMVYDTNGSAVPSSDFYVALDGFRLENKTAQNPLYALTGYSVIKNTDGTPIVKEANSSNIVEFRYGMDVL